MRVCMRFCERAGVLHAILSVYLVGRLKIRALLDQHSHRFHVPKPTRLHQRCKAVLPSQPASVRRSGAAGATQVTVHACVHARVPMHYVWSLCEIK